MCLKAIPAVYAIVLATVSPSSVNGMRSQWGTYIGDDKYGNPMYRSTTTTKRTSCRTTQTSYVKRNGQWVRERPRPRQPRVPKAERRARAQLGELMKPLRDFKNVKPFNYIDIVTMSLPMKIQSAIEIIQGKTCTFESVSASTNRLSELNYNEVLNKVIADFTWSKPAEATRLLKQDVVATINKYVDLWDTEHKASPPAKPDVKDPESENITKGADEREDEKAPEPLVEIPHDLKPLRKQLVDCAYLNFSIPEAGTYIMKYAELNLPDHSELRLSPSALKEFREHDVDNLSKTLRRQIRRLERIAKDAPPEAQDFKHFRKHLNRFLNVQ